MKGSLIRYPARDTERAQYFAAMSGSDREPHSEVRIPLRTLSERAARRRTFDERLRLRFPRPFQRLTEAMLRLPPGSTLRRAVLARAMVRAYAAANRHDFELILTAYDPERYEYRPSPDLLPPDLETTFHGHEGYLTLWRYWTDAFEDIRWDPEEVLDLGDKALVSTLQSGHGAGSGIGVSKPVFQLFTFRRGLVVSQQDFLDRAQAFEAAGLRE